MNSGITVAERKKIVMEKVAFKICQRDYSLKTDENPEMIIKLARQLERSIGQIARIARSTSEIEITTLAAMIEICDIQGRLNADSAALEQVKQQLSETEQKTKSDIQGLTADLSKRDNEIKALKESAEKFEAVINAKESIIAESDKRTEEKIKAITDDFSQKETELNNSVKILKEQNSSKDAQIRELTAKLTKAENLLKQQQEYSAKQNAQNESKLKEENQKLVQEITNLKDMAQSAESQFEQLAAVKDEEAERLRLRVQEYENELKTVTAQQEKEIEAVYEEHQKECRLIDEKREKQIEQLKDDNKKQINLLKEDNEKQLAQMKENCDNRVSEALRQLEDQKQETEKVRKTLSNYEDTFDMYVRNKTAELKQALEEAEAVKAKNAELEKRLAKIGDVQMTIC